jgi:hypothetical protein
MYTYTALICKYTQFQNHQNKRSMIWDYLSDLHEEEFKFFTMEYMTNLITT